MLERAFMPVALFRGVAGTWIVIPCWQSIHSPIVNLVDPMDAHSSPFFVIWFRARTRVR